VKHRLLGVAALMLMAQAPATPPAPTEPPAPAPTPAPPAATAPGANPIVRPSPVTPKPLDQPTPMAERVITFAVLNKNNGQTRDFRVRPGTVVNYGRLTIRARACEATPPWERPWSGAFLQIDDRPKRGGTKRVFSGWLFAESPSINSFDHPVYDVWVKSCAMSFPEIGADTIVAGRSSPAAARASSAKKSASTDNAESNDAR
jgi:hypothetical protein